MYVARYCRINNEPESGIAWRMIDTDDDLALVIDNDTDLKFARKIDCELACRSFNEVIATGEDILETSDERFGFLLTRYLQW